ncbi:hypothetical protein U1Q18_047118 [Sarracenia purpurea var. burkii]
MEPVKHKDALCCACNGSLFNAPSGTPEPQPLISTICGHVYHSSCFRENFHSASTLSGELFFVECPKRVCDEQIRPDNYVLIIADTREILLSTSANAVSSESSEALETADQAATDERSAQIVALKAQMVALDSQIKGLSIELDASRECNRLIQEELREAYESFRQSPKDTSQVNPIVGGLPTIQEALDEQINHLHIEDNQESMEVTHVHTNEEGATLTSVADDTSANPTKSLPTTTADEAAMNEKKVISLPSMSSTALELTYVPVESAGTTVTPISAIGFLPEMRNVRDIELNHALWRVIELVNPLGQAAALDAVPVVGVPSTTSPATGAPVLGPVASRSSPGFPPLPPTQLLTFSQAVARPAAPRNANSNTVRRAAGGGRNQRRIARAISYEGGESPLRRVANPQIRRPVIAARRPINRRPANVVQRQLPQQQPQRQQQPQVEPDPANPPSEYVDLASTPDHIRPFTSLILFRRGFTVTANAATQAYFIHKYMLIGDGSLAAAAWLHLSKTRTTEPPVVPNVTAPSRFLGHNVGYNPLSTAFEQQPEVPPCVILCFGTNALTNNVPLQDLITQFGQVIRGLAQHHVREVVVVPPMRIPTRERDWAEFVGRLRIFVPPEGVQYTYIRDLEELLTQTRPQ